VRIDALPFWLDITSSGVRVLPFWARRRSFSALARAACRRRSYTTTLPYYLYRLRTAISDSHAVLLFVTRYLWRRWR
jgi:hypothetical protein